MLKTIEIMATNDPNVRLGFSHWEMLLETLEESIEESHIDKTIQGRWVCCETVSRVSTKNMYTWTHRQLASPGKDDPRQIWSAASS